VEHHGETRVPAYHLLTTWAFDDWTDEARERIAVELANAGVVTDPEVGALGDGSEVTLALGRVHPTDTGVEATADRGVSPSVTRAVWALAIPILFAEVGEALTYATDTAFLGRVGTKELAAIGLSYSFIELLAVPALGAVEGMQIVVARRVGEDRRDAIGPTFARVLLLVVAISLALSAGLTLGAPAAAPLVIGSGELAAAVADFLQIAAFGLVPMTMSFAFSSLFVALGRPRVLIGATLVLVLTNLAGSYVLVLGELGAPRLGIQGAAYAFLAAELATLLYLVIHAVRRLDLRSLGGLALGRVPAPVFGPLLRLSAPMVLLFFVLEGQWLAFFLIVERVGPDELASSSIVYACVAVLVIPALAFGETAYTLVSKLIGRGRSDEIGSLMRRVVLLAYLVTAPLLVITLALPDVALSVFTSDPSSVPGARATLQVAAVALLVVIPAQSWLGALVGTGDTDIALLIELLSTAVLLASAALIGLQLDLELPYIWLSLLAGAVVTLLAAYLFVRGGRWRRANV